MMSIEQQRYREQYAFKAGLVNICDLVGMARKVDNRAGVAWMQQGNNMNHMIPIRLRHGDRFPTWFKDGALAKIRARIMPGLEGTERTCVIQPIGFDFPNVIDLPPQKAWEMQVRDGVPTDGTKPEKFGPSSAQEKFETGGSSNSVTLAGYLAGMLVEPPGVARPDGGRNDGLLVLGIRQTANPDDIIPVRLYGPKVKTVAKNLTIGCPLLVIGRVEVRLKNTGEKDEATGIIPVSRYPFVRTSTLRNAQPKVHILVDTPAWALELQQANNKSTARAQESREDGSTAAANSQVGGGMNAADFMIDPSVLASMQGVEPTSRNTLGSS